MPIQKTKYQQAILYICHALGGEVRGKKKLAKLLYYADFDNFELHHAPITGTSYKALPMGPFPVALNDIIHDMEQKHMLKIEVIPERKGYIPTEVYRSLTKPEPAVFSPEEKKMLDRIITKYGHLNGKQLEQLTHREAPYIGTKLKQEIPYELAFYRGTNFCEA
ncbi:SocA family protein [bacterium]|nr:SocA family protein [bacterium]MCI0690385.1 SocA family protein [candidate division KSB1 bacterium]